MPFVPIRKKGKLPGECHQQAYGTEYSQDVCEIQKTALKAGAKVLIIDDVISAGTSVRESVEIIKIQNARPAGVIIALDRQEKGQTEQSAIQQVETDLNIPVISIISLTNLLNYLKDNPKFAEHLPAVEAYRERYGVEI